MHAAAIDPDSNSNEPRPAAKTKTSAAIALVEQFFYDNPNSPWKPLPEQLLDALIATS